MKALRRQQCLTRCVLGGILLASIGFALLPYWVESRLSVVSATEWRLFATASTICCSFLGMILLYRSDCLDRQGIRLAETRALAEQDELLYAARHDALTGLGNRLLLRERFAEIEKNVGCGADPAIMLFIDLDDFKRINDSSGHACGDAHLRVVADRIRSCVRANDTVARIGGDEFIAVITSGTSPEELAWMGDMLVDRACDPIAYGGETLRIGASVGVAVFPDHGRSRRDLVEAADAALYRAKNTGRNRVCSPADDPQA
ncbi:MAG: GGDEF domain-containing protein [Geminicoccaceae bacterium]|nr:GGDEF domain-containing protein [Geminicoccaceae bacterium]